MNIVVVVATHKKYRMPESSIYLPIQVGAEGKDDIGYVRDNTRIHISEKNAYFCELTGLYWAWKNVDCDYLGIVHYRRYFTMKNRSYIRKCRQCVGDRMNCVLNDGDIEKLCRTYDVILPKKRHYYIETLYSHYAHSHYAEHLDIAREVLQEKYPQYLSAFDKVMNSRSGYMFNMYIMKKELSDQYCGWLFDILFEMEDRIDMSRLSAFQQRLFGRVSELLFNVWLDYCIENFSCNWKEIGILYVEQANYKEKVKAFLAAKFAHKKYEKSF